MRGVSSAFLYDAAFMEHARAPRGSVPLREASATGRATNPLCGDEVELALRIEDGRVRAVSHRERGCVVVTVSASLLAELLVDRTADEIAALAEALRAALTGRAPLPPVFAALAPVRLLPSRHRCALLPWEALRGALAEVQA